MSIQGLGNTPAYGESRRAAARQTVSACASFQSRLGKTAAGEAEGLHLYMGEDAACSGGIAGKDGKLQEFCAHYTEDSTLEDPIVRISGAADSGPFDFICHINDVDPANASYAELAALRGHLVKTGRWTADAGPLPNTMDFREDITEKYDFISGIRNSLCQPSHIVPTAASIAGANELLALYQNYTSGAAGAAPAPCWPAAGGQLTRGGLTDTLNDARLLLLQRTKEGREWKKEQEEWDRLMKCLDSWIEALRERAEERRKGRGDDNITAEGGEALMALYRGLIAGAVQAEAAGTDPKTAAEDLLAALTEAQAVLLERLKEDKAMAEERQEWEDLMRRLDEWIDELRGEAKEPERAPRAESVSAAESGMGEYET